MSYLSQPVPGSWSSSLLQPPFASVSYSASLAKNEV